MRVVTSATAPRVDGRVQRGERTRNAIADALLSLLEAGVPSPTAREIAGEAGVSLRSVFQHFDDMEALFAMCVERQLERTADLWAPVAASGTLADRIEGFVTQRARLYERIAPVRRATDVAAPSSPALQRGIANADAMHRRDVARVFGEALRGPDRRARAAAVEAATSFASWDHLRRVQRLSVAAARRAVVLLVTGALR